MSSTQQLLLGEGAGSSAPVFIEDVYSTYLYTGNGSTQTITNGIDLATKGGLVWIKQRQAVYVHLLTDSTMSRGQRLDSSTSDGISNNAPYNVTSLNSNGFSLFDETSGVYGVNGSPGGANSGTNAQYVSWTFRKQPKFFDIQTWTGNGAVRNIAHNLGSVPGCIMVKRTNTNRDWAVYHRSLANTQYMVLNSAAGAATGANRWDSTTPTSTVFTVGTNADVNDSSSTYVAYIFAHDAGGFGLLGTDNVISCGSFSGSVEVNLGYEAQWILFKDSAGGDWYMQDIMRGMAQTQGLGLVANTSAAESNFGPFIIPTATGFKNVGGGNYIYIAIRRGPMKTPTDATTVFSPNYPPAAQLSPYTATTNFPVDLCLSTIAGSGPYNRTAIDRLRGNSAPTQSAIIQPNLTNAESASGLGNYQSLASNTALIDNAFWSGYSLRPIYWLFRRAPSFFDEVCYTGTGIDPTTFSHNLTVIPELLIIKRRSGISSWPVFYNFVGSTFDKLQGLDQTGGASTGQSYTGGAGLGGAPTATTFTTDNTSTINGSGSTFVAYLFATCAGVSKVGSYTGNGTTQTINCGFTGGARFVLIKRTDATGDWYVYDTARGMSVSTDPYSLLNTTGAEVATVGSVTTVATGFALNSAVLADINISAGTYIFLAIA